MSLTIPLAIEKVLFRLALQNGGRVSAVRLFVELPLTLEEIEVHADKLADGHTVLRDDWGDFLAYEFPELLDGAPGAPEGCPTCSNEAPPRPTDGGEEVRAPMVCPECYDKLRRLHAEPGDPGFLDKMRERFWGKDKDSAEDRTELARLEHEIVFVGLTLQREHITHTALAAQSRHPALALRERLEKLASRRYIHQGLTPSGDAVGYRFPPDADYPRPHYQRLAQRAGNRVRGLKLEEAPAAPEESRFKIRRRQDQVPAPPPPPSLKIVIKDRKKT